MDLALALSALLLGLAGSPHCAAMCGPSCAALLGRASAGSVPVRPALAFHGARVLSYALAGALAAAGVTVLASAGSAAPLLRPVWSLVHVAALALGVWLLWTGRQPGWMTHIGRARPVVPLAPGWQPVASPQRPPSTSSTLTAAAAGAAWVAWPCGLLQSALIVAALANTPQAGATVMAAFALASAAGLQLMPWLQARLAARVGGERVTTVAVRFAGAALASGSAWALGHDVWDKVVAYCT